MGVIRGGENEGREGLRGLGGEEIEGEGGLQCAN